MGSLNSNFLILIILLNLSCFHVLVVPVSAKVFLNIDCGSSASKPYIDGDYSLEWIGDDQYIQTGEAREVSTSWGPPWNTVREFPTRNKNCYSIDINDDTSKKSSKQVERVLVRASFYYNNYDDKSNPPTFQLQFNGNFWEQIQTPMTLTSREVVYSLNHGNTITICLAQTHPDNVPFISYIEVRSLDSDMYSYVDSSYPLIFKRRRVYGTDTNLRYPEDSYDRLWISSIPPNKTVSTFTWVNNTSPSVKVNISDQIPKALFRTALTPLNSSGEIWISGTITNHSVPLHLNAYFTEVIRLNSTQKRSFNISVLKTGDSSFSVYDNVIPTYGDALQVRIENVTINSDDYWEIGLVPTKDSTLPPLINALEGYIIGDKLVQGTNSNDVSSLALLQKSFSQLQDWQGDPCLPSPYTWDWVACDSDTDSPRITSLYLNDLGLVGTLPDFSDMDALQTIDLSGNSLTREIPGFLGTFPKLKVLNLANNNFSGAIPSSLLNNNNLKLTVSGNPNLSTNNTSGNRNSTEPRIPSSSNNNNNSITSTISIIILGGVMIQILDYIFGF